VSDNSIGIDFDRIAKALADEESRLRGLIDSLRLEISEIGEAAGNSDLSSYDQHPADAGTETYERSKDTGFLLSAERQLEQVVEAKKRLASGSFGRCASCGHPIDPERLYALPYAENCRPCQDEEEEVSRAGRPQGVVYQSHAREHILTPFADDEEEVTADWEEAWRQLAEYGSDAEYGFEPGSAADIVAGDDVDEELLRTVNEQFPGDPEMELARELTPELEAEWRRQYAADKRKERGKSGEKAE